MVDGPETKGKLTKRSYWLDRSAPILWVLTFRTQTKMIQNYVPWGGGGR